VGVAGLGRSVLDVQSGGAYDRMYALVLTAGLLGLGLDALLRVAERRLLFWHPSHRPSVSSAPPAPTVVEAVA
jgi:ABC-type nitrate/sulfonate/bicarbonate transport system permease component